VNIITVVGLVALLRACIKFEIPSLQRHVPIRMRWRIFSESSSHTQQYARLSNIHVKFVVNHVCAESVIAARQEELYATEGTQVTLGCDTVEKQPIAYCRFLTPRLLGFAVDEKSNAQPPPRYAYSGQGLTAGHCGLSVDRVDDSDYGNWTCAVKILDSSGSEEVSTTVLLRKPEGIYIYYITTYHH